MSVSAYPQPIKKDSVSNARLRDFSAALGLDDAPLGNIANISSKHKTRSDYYRLLSHAQNLLCDHDVLSRQGNPHRTRSCLGARRHGAESITLRLSANPENSSASIGNVQTCASVWSCPVCAARIAVQRGKEIEAALSWADEAGLIPVMVSLTARHHSGMRLADFKDSFKNAWRRFSSGGAWQSLKKTYRVETWIANREPNYGANGWHYHMHMLLFMPRSVVATAAQHDSLAADLRTRWLKCLAKADLEGIGQYALDVSSHGSVGKDYLSKLGLAAENTVTDLRYEMSGAANKDGGGISVFGLLRKSANGDQPATGLYLEYVAAMQGENWITWSHGFKALVGVDEVVDQQAADDENNDSDVMLDWMAISDDAYRPVRRFRAYKDLIDVAASSRSREAVNAFLDLLQCEMEARKTDLSAAAKLEIKEIRADVTRWRANLQFSRNHVKDETLRKQYIADFSAKIRQATERLHQLT